MKPTVQSSLTFGPVPGCGRRVFVGLPAAVGHEVARLNEAPLRVRATLEDHTADPKRGDH